MVSQETNVDNCRRNLETNRKDMDMIKDCITTTEVRTWCPGGWLLSHRWFCRSAWPAYTTMR